MMDIIKLGIQLYWTEICFIIFRSEYESIMRASVIRVNAVISDIIMTKLITVLVAIFASVIFKIPLRPAELFTVLPLISLVVESVVCRTIFGQGIRIIDVRVTIQRIEVNVLIKTYYKNVARYCSQ